jgi:outer membrane protein assembly factor BamB
MRLPERKFTTEARRTRRTGEVMKRRIEVRSGWVLVALTLVMGGIAGFAAGMPGETESVGASTEKTGKGKDWPMWGGAPGRNMVNLAERGIPATWDVEARKNIKWKADLGSRSYGNTVVAGGRVFVGTNNERVRSPKVTGDKGVLMCFRESDGVFLWQAVHDKLPAGRVNDWPEEGICSSPAVEGNRVYYVSNRCELVCADVEGFLDGENDGPFSDEKFREPIDADFVWVLDMIEELSVFPHNLATSSPLVVGDLIYIVTSNGVDESHITIPQPDAPSFIAVDKRTGKVAWEDGSPGGNILHGQWSSPAYGVLAGRPQVVFPGGDGWLYAFEPLTGKPLWKFDLNPKDSKWELGGRGTRNNIIATPVIAGGRVYLGVGQDPEHGEGVGNLYAIDPAAAFPPHAAEGEARPIDITASGQVWHLGGKEFRRTLSTVAVHEGIVYAANLSGHLHALDAATGRPRWSHDCLSAVWGSPTVIDGKLLIGNEDGDVLVFAAGSEKKLLAKNVMPSAVYGTPVAANGVLYVADRTTLYAIEERS